MSDEQRPSPEGEPEEPGRGGPGRASEETGGHTRTSRPPTPGPDTQKAASGETGGHTRNSPPEKPGPENATSSSGPGSGEEGFWSAYWERFRRQQVDDPIEQRREGLWDRFKRQDIDDPVRGGRT